MNKPLKPIPKFASEAEERAFWETPDNDSTAYLDWSKAKRAVFPNLKPSTQAISLRDRKSTRLNSSHQIISYAVFCLKKKKTKKKRPSSTKSWTTAYATRLRKNCGIG